MREKKDEEGGSQSQTQPSHRAAPASQRIAATPQPQAPAVKIEIEGSDTEPESEAEDAPVNVKRQPVSPAKVKPESKGKGMPVKKEEEEDAEEEGETDIWAELRPRTEYFTWKEDVLAKKAEEALKVHPTPFTPLPLIIIANIRIA